MMLCHTSKFPLHFIGCVNESKIHRKGLSSRLAISSHNTIGVLGGVSAHSTVDFLEKLVKWSSECKPGNLPFIACNDPVLNKELSSCERSSSPYLSSRNTPYQFNESLIIENLRSKRLFLEQSGSRCIVMPCHVSHVWYNEVSRGCSVPFFHIGECVARELKEANLKPVEAGSNLRIGVIATEAILKSGFYQEQLKNLDCIGMIDGTHVDATLPMELQPRFRGRKGVTQNILAACTPNKLFTYILAGWEGSANDYTILKDALSKPPPHGLRVIEGKYYLCDAGYTTGHGFIAPYRGVRYHLKEHSGRTPNNRYELFNLRHSTLRTKIEAAFGILKNRFKILAAKPYHPFTTQVNIVLACGILHNYIGMEDPDDELFNTELNIVEDETPEIPDVVSFATNQSQAELATNRQHWKECREHIAWTMWIDYCNHNRHGNVTETGTY